MVKANCSRASSRASASISFEPRTGAQAAPRPNPSTRKLQFGSATAGRGIPVANELQRRSHLVHRIQLRGVRNLYVCNCNGIREREVRAAIEAGARRPAEVFRACDSKPRCARCVCDMREMLDEQAEALKFAAE